MPGYLGHELQRCFERPDHYMLLVRWGSVEHHEQGFRGSPQYQEWRKLLHHFYDPFPTVLHYQKVAGQGQETNERGRSPNPLERTSSRSGAPQLRLQASENISTLMNDHSAYTVRPFQPEDAESMFLAVSASIAELSPWLPWCTPNYSREDAARWVLFTVEAWSRGTEFPLGIFEKSTNSVVGGTGINHIDRANGIGNIGYWVSTSCAGKGIARFAAREAARLGFLELGLTRLEIVTLTDNVRSQRVAHALGATQECYARNRLRIRGEARDAIVYSLVPGDMARWRQGTFG